MPSESITNNPTEPVIPKPVASLAPSVMREDDQVVPRAMGLIGASILFFSGAVLFMMRFGFRNRLADFFGPSAFSILLMGGVALGLALMLFHASFDRELSFRRLYAAFGGVVPLLVGLLLMVLPWPNAVGDLFAPGLLCLFIALLFLLSFLRVETEPDLQFGTQLVLVGVGSLLAVIGLIASGLYSNMLLPYGLLLGLLGLCYLVAFVVSRRVDDFGYMAGLAIAGFGLAAVAISMVRSYFPGWFHSGIGEPPPFFIPRGVLLLTMGLIYLGVSIGLLSENRIVVLMRRELGAYFFSPIIYLMLIGFIVVQWFFFAEFVNQIAFVFDPQLGAYTPREAVREPIVTLYLYNFWPIIFCIFIVPILTMRLISEEKRSGTLELMLTAPVDEIHIVISKFLAALLMFLLMWIPMFLFLIAVRTGNLVEESKRDFDYLPLLGFWLTLIFTGAMFISIGLFFSSLTRDQMTSGVLTFAAMLALTMVFFILGIYLPGEEFNEGNPSTPALAMVLRHISYINTWFDAMNGKIVLKYLIFPISATFFFLFLSTKVLEARKWS